MAKLTVRFYWDHEPNLIVLASHPNFDIRKWTKEALIAYVRGEPLKIPLPKDVPFSGKMRNYAMQFTLSETSESDVLEWINKIQLGYRNSTIKQILEHSLDDSYLYPLVEQREKVYVVNVGLYWQHDLDLIALNRHPDFDLGAEMKNALKAYAAHDEDFRIDPPDDPEKVLDLDDCSVSFELSAGQDDEAISCLNEFLGFRNSAVIQIFRHYLSRPFINPMTREDKYRLRAHQEEEWLRSRKKHRPMGRDDMAEEENGRKRRQPQAAQAVPDSSGDDSAGHTDEHKSAEKLKAERAVKPAEPSEGVKASSPGPEEKPDENARDESKRQADVERLDVDLEGEDERSVENEDFDFFSAIDAINNN